MKKIQKKYYVTLFLTMLLSSNLPAEEIDDISINKAYTNIVNYLKKNNLITFSDNVSYKTLYSYYNKNNIKYNIITFNPSGYLVLSGNYEYDPIIHFSNKKWNAKIKDELINSIMIKKDKPNIYKKKWTDFIKKEDRNQEPRERRSNRDSNTEEKLLKTVNWNQNGTLNSNSVDYSSQMPFVTNMQDNPNGRAYTGCVANAMGISMNYHQYPLMSPITNTNYNWSYNRFDNSLARLMEEINIDGSADYSTSGTGMNQTSMLSTLRNFGYNTESYREHTVTGMYSFSKKHISRDRPVLLWGREWTSELLGLGSNWKHGWNHTVVVDGYKKVSGSFDDDYYLHINYGWGGYGNRWWKIDSLADIVWSDRLGTKSLDVAYPPESFWTGNGSIISYHGSKRANTKDKEYPYAITTDTTVAHSRSNQKPVGFFQWQASTNCTKLKIDYAGNMKKADITVGDWSNRDNDVTFQNISLPFVIGKNNSGLDLSTDGKGWGVVAVELKDKVKNSARINATCTSEIESQYQELLKKAKPIIFSDGYQWNGNASIISRIFEKEKDTKEKNHDWPYGVFKDVTQVHPSIGKSIVFFQWMSSKVCEELIIDAPSLIGTEKKVILGIKNWNSSTIGTRRVTLPQTIKSEGRLWNVIKVRFVNSVSKTARVEATCKGF